MAANGNSNTNGRRERKARDIVAGLPVTHVYPEGDMREHDLDGSLCWCSPSIDFEAGSAIVMHNSLDRRELYTSGQIKRH